MQKDIRRAERRPSTLQNAPTKPPALIWRGTEYPRMEPGIYQVRGVSYQGPEWLRTYQRWALRVEFELVTEPGRASAFPNFGTDPREPRVGRQSKYWKEWVKANGELPRKGQEMTPDIFLEGQFFTVAIEDATVDSDRAIKSDAEVYSKITKFHSVDRP